ncbi:DUF3800 domain-containing protein, partial [Acidobacteriota bacterium]
NWECNILFFFDDSGDFSILENESMKISLWIGCLIPENSYAPLTKKFIKWEGTLKSYERKKGEAKGTLLTAKSRDAFFRLINNVPSMLVYPTILDLKAQKQCMPQSITKEAYENSLKNIVKIKSEKFKQEELLQANRIKNMSDVQYLKLMTLGTCIVELLRHSLTFRVHGKYETNWKDITYFVDRSSARNSREEKVFRRSIQWFLFNSTRRMPILLPDDMFFTNHPFIKNFDTPNGIDMEKLFKNINFEDSLNQIGLRIADIIANTLFRLLNDLENKNGMLRYYKRIMRHNYLGSNSNLGFIFFPSDKQKAKTVYLKEYAILQHIISKINNGRPDLN